MESEGNPKVYFDISIGLQDAGRMVFELFEETTPITTHNFIELCKGFYPNGTRSGRGLQYKGSVFHRVIKGFMVQGGDFQNHDGTGGESIYGPTFADETFVHKHTGRGVLAMANCGPDTNGSQFYILFKSAPHLNGKHVVFGRLVSGSSILDQIEAVRTDQSDRPQQQVSIRDCGVLTSEAQADQAQPKAETETQTSVDAAPAAPAAPTSAQTTADATDASATSTLAPTPASSQPAAAAASARDSVDLGFDVSGSESDSDAAPPAAPAASLGAHAGRLEQLRARMGAAIKANQRDAKDEYHRLSTGARGGRRVYVKEGEVLHGRRPAEPREGEAAEEEDDEDEGSSKRGRRRPGQAKRARGEAPPAAGSSGVLGDVGLLLGEMQRGAWECDRAAERDRARAAREGQLGAYVHTEAAKIEQYERAAAAMPRGVNTNAPVSAVVAPAATRAQAQTLAAEAREKRDKGPEAFSRRRHHVEGAFAGSINSANERMNAKIEKDYGKYTADVKGALERGSAL